MTKIKNFRIALRPREMARWLKKERGMETTPELEVSIEQAIKEVRPWIEPAALYTTLTRQVAEKTTAISFPAKAIAVSVIGVSIGLGLETQRQKAEAEPAQESLWAALQQEALAQAIHFTVRLVQEQAKEEDCDMSSPAFLHELAFEGTQPTAGALATLLGLQRIGVTVDASAAELPAHARLAWLFWTPVGKTSARLKTGTPTGKPAVAEKIAV